MTRVELTEARAPLADYARKAKSGPVVLTRRGRPVALLRLLTDEEREDFLVSTHPGFVELIRRSREECPPGSGMALEDVERELGLSPARPVARRRRRAVRRPGVRS
jgi:antitoxin (DNA-binding transcriptional repressor) of toxin-antitoxin stability system